MYFSRKIIHILGLVIFLSGCKSHQNTEKKHSKNKFSDAQICKIYDLADRRNTDSLLILSDQLPEKYHAEIAMTLASVQDSMALPILFKYLNSPVAQIRQNAAYAIGQVGHITAQKKLIEHIEKEKNEEVKIRLMEALGKSTDSLGIQYLSSQEYKTEPEKYGQILGVYRALRRGFSDPRAVQKAVYFLEVAEDSERLHLKASEYLAVNRLEDYLNIPVFVEKMSVYEAIVRFIRMSYNPFVRMNLVRACQHYVGKIPQNYTDSLALTLKFDKNEVVRIACARTLAKGKNVTKHLVEALSDRSPNVRVALAQTLVKIHENIDFKTVLKHEKLGFREQAILMKGAIKQDSTYAKTIIRTYKNTSNLYQKGLLLGALAQYGTYFEFIKNELFHFESPIIATYAMEVLLDMRHKTLENTEKYKIAFDTILRFALENGDASLGYLAANELQNPDRNYKERFKNLDVLRQAIQNLELPKAQETYIALQQAYQFLTTGKKNAIPAPAFNHPIDWKKIREIPKTQQVEVYTSKGNMIWDLYVEQSPGTVLSFLQLVDQGFYENKTFHRVVPNFVAQGGCPRGDGFGSSEYSIRSELSDLNYQEGSVGMASAGKDTEGCQWFISHIPTPRLDGRYTIFGRMKTGFEVLHKLEMGDKIEKIKRL